MHAATLSCNLQNFGLTYVYVVHPGAEQWPDKINCGPAIQTMAGQGFSALTHSEIVLEIAQRTLES